MRILSLDQALDKTGFSIIQNEELVKYGVLDLTDISRIKDLTLDQKLEERITNVKEFLKRMIDTYEINIVILEDIQSQKNVKTYKNLASLQGNLKNYLYNKEIPFAVLKPSEWRSSLGIKGRERKIQKKNAQVYVKYNFGYDVTEDEADAICIGISGSKKLKKNKLEIIKEY